jgi:hypothetical protein
MNIKLTIPFELVFVAATTDTFFYGISLSEMTENRCGFDVSETFVFSGICIKR